MGQHECGREASSKVLTPPLLSIYVFHTRNLLNKTSAFYELNSTEFSKVTREIYGGPQDEVSQLS